VQTKKTNPQKSIQLVFSNFYLGIALGAFDFASKYTASNTRPWPFGGDNKDKATDEFYILERYGNFHAHLRAAEALADRAGQVIASIYTTRSEKRDISARERGEAAEWVASVKVVAADTGLRVTAGVFEVTGARPGQRVPAWDWIGTGGMSGRIRFTIRLAIRIGSWGGLCCWMKCRNQLGILRPQWLCCRQP
jgi:alkylation response protein AidB-like acyl-CoA dehydrogenase